MSTERTLFKMPPDVSLIIKTFERRLALERLLDSIRDQGYGHCPILIADDSKEPYRDAILDQYGDIVDSYIVLPFDSGLSKGRNELLKRVETTYFVLNDDDFVYDERTDLAWMRKQLEHSEVELLTTVLYRSHIDELLSSSQLLSKGFLTQLIRHPIEYMRSFMNGGLGKCNDVARFSGFLEIQDRTVILRTLAQYTPPYTRCDYGYNFFMADTRAVHSKAGGWMEELKLAEHWEFFYRAKRGGLRVATTEEVGVVDPPSLSFNSETYDHHRIDRFERFRRMGLEAHGFENLQFR